MENTKANGIEIWNKMPNWNGKTSFGLENVAKILEILGHPENKPRSIHIAGTNGKGSTTTAIGKMLLLSGYKVGVLTSPHLIKINERININGKDINDEDLSQNILKVLKYSKENGIELSKHELITVASFLACENLDWIVVEVGLGGRLDASNVLKKPEVAVITTIDYDHMAILGNTLEEIAREKAGIIKNNQKIVLGNIAEAPKKEILKIAKEKNAEVYQLNKDFFHFTNTKNEIFYRGTSYRDLRLVLGLLGQHQLDNMAVALKVAELLNLKSDICQEAINGCKLPCRLEIFEKNRTKILLDSAHNPAGVKTLISFLELKKENKEDFSTILFGVFADKNWQEMLDLLKPVIVNWNIILAPDARGLDSHTIRDYLQSRGVKEIVILNKFEDALESLIARGDNFVIAGSMSIVGEARRLLLENYNIK